MIAAVLQIGVFSKGFARKVVRATKIVLGERDDKRFTQPRHTDTYFPLLLGKTTTTHALNTTETVTIYRGTTKGSESASADQVQAYNRFGELASDEWVILVYLNAGWEILAANPCEE